MASEVSESYNKNDIVLKNEIQINIQRDYHLLTFKSSFGLLMTAGDGMTFSNSFSSMSQ